MMISKRSVHDEREGTPRLNCADIFAIPPGGQRYRPSAGGLFMRLAIFSCRSNTAASTFVCPS